MGWREWSNIPTVDVRLFDHVEMGPRLVSDQLVERTSAPVMPPPLRNVRSAAA
jgi:hypothetical protein